MVKPTILREIAIEHYKKNKSYNEIYEALGKKVTERYIRNWIDIYKKSGRSSPNFSSGRPRTALNSNNMQKIKRLFSERFTCRKIGRFKR